MTFGQSFNKIATSVQLIIILNFLLNLVKDSSFIRSISFGFIIKIILSINNLVNFTFLLVLSKM